MGQDIVTKEKALPRGSDIDRQYKRETDTHVDEIGIGFVRSEWEGWFWLEQEKEQLPYRIRLH